MRRFFCPPEFIYKDKAQIQDKDQLHHMVDVLRLKRNDRLVLFDGKGNDYTCRIDAIKKDGLALNIIKKSLRRRKSANITLACALTRRSKFDLL